MLYEHARRHPAHDQRIQEVGRIDHQSIFLRCLPDACHIHYYQGLTVDKIWDPVNRVLDFFFRRVPLSPPWTPGANQEYRRLLASWPECHGAVGGAGRTSLHAIAVLDPLFSSEKVLAGGSWRW